MLLFGKGHFPDFPLSLVQTSTPVALFQILVRVLRAQCDDSSWGSREETAYALLELVFLSSLPFISIMMPTIQAAVEPGRRFLLETTRDMRVTNVYRIPPSHTLMSLQIFMPHVASFVDIHRRPARLNASFWSRSRRSIALYASTASYLSTEISRISNCSLILLRGSYTY